MTEYMILRKCATSYLLYILVHWSFKVDIRARQKFYVHVTNDLLASLCTNFSAISAINEKFELRLEDAEIHVI